MPSHWSSPDLHIVSKSSATGTQMLHAVGGADGVIDRVEAIADRQSRFHADEVIFVSSGQGDERRRVLGSAQRRLHEQLPLLFLVEDNGYAIPAPVEAQTAGGDISTCSIVPWLACRLSGRHRSVRQRQRDARGCRLCPRA
jgi:2-oxoisovalerate dehydrogenase E1 component